MDLDSRKRRGSLLSTIYDIPPINRRCLPSFVPPGFVEVELHRSFVLVCEDCSEWGCYGSLVLEMCFC
ncbi:hypothetical protein J5N97_006869 [Dioscorea zingiberensis]|uniref:Uncharacterized protein n=1 Tax=Dioscorea zingiberensis TaxID=325984 RepID=A0A9D5DAW2_9LILI|nr:hypothetical protein J5N97_006869 [Dioscorea zingiberensis]